MDILASLAKEAGELARRLLIASETASQKLERIFSTLLSSDVDIEALDKSAQQNVAVGHGFAILFLLAGVTGMPHIQGKDAQEWMTEWKAAHPGSWDHQKTELSKDRGLPRTYGSDIPAPLYSTAMQIGKGDRERADDYVMEVYAKFWGGAGQHIQPVSLKQAIGFVQKSIFNFGANIIKKVDKRERPLTRTDDEGEEIEQEIKSDHTLEDIMDDHNARMIVEKIMTDPKTKSELERVHIDALQYLQLIAKGEEDPKILGVTARGERIGEPLLHHPLTKGTSGVPLTPQNWTPKKHQMFDIIKKHFLGGEHHEMFASYDYSRTASNEFWKPVMDETPKKVGITWVRPGNQRDGEAHAFEEAAFDDGSVVVNNVSLCWKKFQSSAISKARAHGNTSSAVCPDCKAKSGHYRVMKATGLKWELNSKIPAHYAETSEGTYWVMPEGHNIFVASFTPKGENKKHLLGHKPTAAEAQKLAEEDAAKHHTKTAGRNGHVILEAGKVTFQMPVTMPPRFTGSDLDKTIHSLGREGLDRIMKTVSRNVPKLQYGITDAYASDQGHGKGLQLVATGHWKGDSAQLATALQGFSDALGFSLDNWL